MPYALMIKFYGSFLAIVLMCYSIWVFITNKEVAIKTQRLMRETRDLECLVIKNVRVSNSELYRRHGGISLRNTADLYLFDDFLLIFRTQNIIIKQHFEPFGIAKNPLIIKQQYSIDEIYKPNNILFPSKIKKENNEIRFFYNDLIIPKDRIFFKIKGLSEEQVLQLKKLENWVI
jgi:hypothetical protein